MTFDSEILGDSLSETAGYKSGLALSIEEMCDHLSDTHYADLLRASEEHAVRIRSEEYDQLFYKLLHRIGHTEEEYTGDITGVRLYHKYKNTPLLSTYEGVQKVFVQEWPKLISQASKSATKMLDPRPFIQKAFDQFGRDGLNMAMEQIEVINQGMKLSPHTGLRYTEWSNTESLKNLFKGNSVNPEHGRFFDQRFIDYLHANFDRIGQIHWRKFEELSAEYFHANGFQVELGPGSNDDGVDVRVWKDSQNQESDDPHIIVQCKRQKSKVEKVVVKGLHSDIDFYGADYGLIVTTSELSPGARDTISVRGYDIQEVNNSSLQDWLLQLRTPGTGIVRI